MTVIHPLAGASEEMLNHPTIELNKSLDTQINDARTIAKQYANSIKESRLHEQEALKIIEEERLKFSQSFEMKSVMIEQLERELMTAVDALEAQKRKNFELLAHQAKHNQQSNGYDNPPIPPQQIMNSNRPPSPSRTKAMPSQNNSRAHSNYSVASVNSVHHLETQPSLSTSQEQSNIWNDLLNQYKQQLQLCRQELSQLSDEKNQWIDRVSELEQQCQQILGEKTRLQTVIEDLQGKLSFRTNQVK